MIKAIADLTGEVYTPSPGAVYPTLILMLDEAVIKEHVTGVDGDEGKRSFVASKEGEAELGVRSEEAAALLARLAAMADAQASRSSPAIAAAMERLDDALKARAACGGLESEKAAEIAIWIDDLAGKIKAP